MNKFDCVPWERQPHLQAVAIRWLVEMQRPYPSSYRRSRRRGRPGWLQSCCVPWRKQPHLRAVAARWLAVSGSWKCSDLTQAATGAPPAVGDPAAYVHGDGKSSVVYQGPNNHIYLLWPGDKGWRYSDLTKLTPLTFPTRAFVFCTVVTIVLCTVGKTTTSTSSGTEVASGKVATFLAQLPALPPPPWETRLVTLVRLCTEGQKTTSTC